jgi:hypothetical protein
MLPPWGVVAIVALIAALLVTTTGWICASTARRRSAADAKRWAEHAARSSMAASAAIGILTFETASGDSSPRVRAAIEELGPSDMARIGYP